MLSNVDSRLARHLRLHAERVNPLPGAWSTLESRISREGIEKSQNGLRSISTLFHFESQITRRLALALAIILALLLAAPPALTLAARIGDWVGAWFHFRTPGMDRA